MKKICLVVLNFLLPFGMFANDEPSNASQLLEKQLWINFASESEINGISVDSYSRELKHLIKKSLLLAFSHGHQVGRDELKRNNSMVMTLEGFKKYSEKLKLESFEEGYNACHKKIKSSCTVIIDKDAAVKKINDILAENFDMGVQVGKLCEKKASTRVDSTDFSAQVDFVDLSPQVDLLNLEYEDALSSPIVRAYAMLYGVDGDDHVSVLSIGTDDSFDVEAASINSVSKDTAESIRSRKQPKKRKFNAVDSHYPKDPYAKDPAVNRNYDFVEYEPRSTMSGSQSTVDTK